MVLDAALAVAALAALALGFGVHGWWFLVVLLGAGVIAIGIDVSTRDLTSGGHDDRGLVAIAEAATLLGVMALFAVGVVARNWRDRHHRSSLGRAGT